MSANGVMKEIWRSGINAMAEMAYPAKAAKYRLCRRKCPIRRMPASENVCSVMKSLGAEK
jgi:hypothetical protein